MDAWWLEAAVASPLILAAAGFAIPPLSLVIKSKSFWAAYASVVTGAVLTLIIGIAKHILLSGPVSYWFGGWPPPLGVVYVVDGLSAIFVSIIAAVIFLTVTYSAWYMKKFSAGPWYYTLFLLLEAGSLGCVMTGDLFNLFVMVEVLAVSAYGLVSYFRSSRRSVAASARYAFVGAAATTLYFIAVVFVYGSFGTVNMADVAVKARGLVNQSFKAFSGGVYGEVALASTVAIALSLWVFTFKSGLFPNHFWLPDANAEAPTPVSAAFASAVDAVGIYAVIRLLFTVFGSDSVLERVGARTVIFAVLFALGVGSALVGALLMNVQRDVKRVLAYSTISHVGIIYMAIAAAGLGTTAAAAALTASLYHILTNVVGEALLFLSFGVLIATAGSRDLGKLAGVGRTPSLIAAVGVLVGALTLFGIPPFMGFFSKLLVFISLLDSGLVFGAVMLLVSTAISLMGYVKLARAALSGGGEGSRLGPALPSAVIVVLIVLSLALGVLFPEVKAVLDHVSGAVVGSVNEYVNALSGVIG